MRNRRGRLDKIAIPKVDIWIPPVCHCPVEPVMPLRLGEDVVIRMKRTLHRKIDPDLVRVAQGLDLGWEMVGVDDHAVHLLHQLCVQRQRAGVVARGKGERAWLELVPVGEGVHEDDLRGGRGPVAAGCTGRGSVPHRHFLPQALHPLLVLFPRLLLGGEQAVGVLLHDERHYAHRSYDHQHDHATAPHSSERPRETCQSVIRKTILRSVSYSKVKRSVSYSKDRASQWFEKQEVSQRFERRGQSANDSKDRGQSVIQKADLSQ